MTAKGVIRYINQKKIYGFILGGLIFTFITITYLNPNTPFLFQIDQRLSDIYFGFRSLTETRTTQENVSMTSLRNDVSRDLILVGIDDYSLETFGRWPFPRSVHGKFLTNLARIRDQNQRENSVLLDIFFSEPTQDAVQDALLEAGMSENKRTFLETVLHTGEGPQDYNNKMFERLNSLIEASGELHRVQGDHELMTPFYSLEAPLSAFGRQVKGFGHAIFLPDSDGVFRRQKLILKASRLVDEVPLEAFQPGEKLENLQRYAYVNKNGVLVSIFDDLDAQRLEQLKTQLPELALYRFEDTDGDGTPETENIYIKKFQDYFIPSITLSLAAQYFHKQLDDLEIIIGDAIIIKEPQTINPDSGELIPYQIPRTTYGKDEEGNEIAFVEYEPVPEIRIPIDEEGQMLINFIGARSSPRDNEYRTYDYKSYAQYAGRNVSKDPSTWGPTLVLGNKILMVGPFSSGMADDEKTTPFGLMYGVEIHTNALNTILMNNFIQNMPVGFTLVLAAVLIFIMAFLASRLPTFISLPAGIIMIFIYFMTAVLIFDYSSYYVPFAAGALGISMTFLSILAYRVITEESDKKRIRGMFSKYVSAEVVNQMMDHPPELGGVDKELTVLFSDIRGFTTLSESMSAQELVNHLNVYLSAMTDIIMEYRGTLDKYVGDEIMCFWGAPLDEKEHALLSAQCALRQMEVLGQLNSQWPENRKINIGIGLNSGIMTVGNMGSKGRMNYTLMGDNVNLGARLEGTNKEYKTNVIISENTYALIADQGPIVRELDNIRVKGKNKPVVIYELLDFKQGFYPPGKLPRQ